VNAIRCSCINHCLNVSLTRSSKVPAVRRAMALIRVTGSFFRNSSKKHRRLKEKLKRTLPQVCDTRWLERHEAVIVFLVMFLSTISVLEEISYWKDAISAGKVESALLEPEFIVTLLCLRDLLSMISLSRLLQSETIEAQMASKAVLDTISILDEKRSQAKKKKKKIRSFWRGR